MIAGVSCVGLYYYGARYLDTKYSRWLSADPAVGEYINGASAGEGGIYNTVNFSLYHYAGNNPIKYTDPDGNFVETAWDIASLVSGVGSLVADVKAGNVKGAIIDGLGIVADAAAVALPCIPGGAGVAIKAARAVGAVANIAGGALSVQDGLEKGDYVEAGLGTLQTVSGIGQLGKTLSKGSKLPLGGAYSDVPANGGERHHMPADSVSPLSTQKGPVINMSLGDHKKTASWGRSKYAQEYRAQQRRLINNGDFMRAQQMDIDDVKSKFGNKYNKTIDEMRDYILKLEANGDI